MALLADALRNKLRIHNTRVFTGTGSIAMGNEGVLVVKKAAGAATAVTLPPTPSTGDHAEIKDGNGDAATYNITISGAAAATIDGSATLVLSANYAYAILIWNGTEWSVLANGTQTSGSPTFSNLTQSAGTVSFTPTQTVASGASATLGAFRMPATTITVTGATQVTTAAGFNFASIAAPTYTDSMAVTIDRGATFYIGGPPTAGGSVTLTAPYALWVDSGVTRLDGNIDMSATASDLVIPANTTAALEVSDGTTKLLAVDSRNTVTGANTLTLLSSPATIASAGAALRQSTLVTAAKTVTLSGTTTTTSLLGAGAFFDTVTVTDSMACTLTTLSNLHIATNAAAGGMLTITNSFMVSTGVSDCKLTNAGVWTDTACWAWGKSLIVDATSDMVYRVLDKLTPRSWTYRDDVVGDDLGRERVGIVYDELPDELRAPGQPRLVSTGVLSSFALAALKYLRDENEALRARLERLEARLEAA